MLPLAGAAQVLQTGTIEKLNVPTETPSVAAISPQGNYLLLTSPSGNGLTKFDIKSGETLRLTDATGAGYNTQVSASGESVVYREVTVDKKHLRHVALHSLNLATGKSRRLVKATRNLQGYTVSGEQTTIVNNGKKSVKTLTRGAKKNSVPQLSINDRQLMITVDGETRTLSPNGTDKSYIWPELSPDGSKVAYYVAGEGAYVCNTDGSGVQALGIVRAPKWYGNEVVVGMCDEDNGEYVTSSSIVAVSLSGQRQTLTPSTVKAMYPQPASTAGKISFSTPQGETYILNIGK